jgi:hypothetical protein
VGCIRPCVEYCSHVWGGSRSTSMLASIDRRARRLIDSPPIADTLDSLVLRRTVGALSLFYRYYHGRCSDELSACVPPPIPAPIRPTRAAQARHPFSLVEPPARIERFKRSFFPTVTGMWNALPPDVFPPRDTFSPTVFSSSVSRHLRSLPAHSDAGWGYLVF